MRARVAWLGAMAVTTVLIGDSLAVGLDAPLKSALAPESFQAFAKGGTMVAQWLSGSQANQLAAALSLKPARVLVSLGTNDTNSHVPAATLEKQVYALVQKIRDSGAEVVWLMPGKLPWAYPTLVTAVFKSVVRTIQQPDVKKFDGIHPTGEGYKVWAKHVAEQLRAPAQSSETKTSLAPVIAVAVIAGLFAWLA